MMEYVPLRHEQSMDHDHDHDSHEDMDDDDEGHNHEEGEKYDEHVWTSIRNAERMSASFADEKQRLYSARFRDCNPGMHIHIQGCSRLQNTETEICRRKQAYHAFCYLQLR